MGTMSSADTKADILDAAERLFSQVGYDATSVRDITGAAGVNVAAIHYHFGGKEELLKGVTDRVVAPLNRRRFDLLDALLAVSRAPTVSQLVEAFVRPDVEALQQLSDRGPTVARFLGRLYGDRSERVRRMTGAQFDEVSNRFGPVFARALPHLERAEVEWRIEQMVAVIVHTFASWPESMTDEEAEALIRHLISFLAGALEAESSRGGGDDNET